MSAGLDAGAREREGEASALAGNGGSAHNTEVANDGKETSPKLRMIPCPGCGAKLFLPSDLPPLSTTPCTKCETPVMMPMQLRQFELRAEIASGGMGTVYRAFDTTLQREVAVKLMKRDLAEDEEALDAFYREARACAQLNHTNIIHIYTFDELDGQLYLVMELADRGSLDSWIEQGPVPELDVLDVGIKIASALDCALKKGLLHRDIKPGNILFNAENEPKLVDFGLAQATDARNEPTDDAVWGTPYYIAPEKIRREGESFLSDMYSLAGTLYHALTQHVPFEAPTIEEVVAAHVHTPLTPPDQVVPGISPDTCEAIMIAMAKDPADRYQSYEEFRMALEAARSKYLVNHFVRQRPSAKAKSTRRRGWFRR
jgi:serine/threonine protein kinase